jgi:hypothetical protein
MNEIITDYLTDKELRKVKKGFRVASRKLSRKVLDYVAEHGVYGSMTSSPERLEKASTVISIILTNPYIKRLYINLPHKYRDKEPYSKFVVKYIQELDPRVRICWLKNDIGPISKILPTLKRVRDKKAIIISFDDDVFYPPALINELIFYTVTYPHILPGGAGFNFGDMEDFIKRDGWPERRKPTFPNVDVIEGWGAVAYRKEKVDIKLITKLNKLGTVCKLSDDLTLSFSHSLRGIRRRVISNRYFSGNEDVFPLSYGLGEGALHKGSGTSHIGEGDANMIKYRDCLEIIKNEI